MAKKKTIESADRDNEQTPVVVALEQARDRATAAWPPEEVDAREFRLFAALDLERKGYIRRADLESVIYDMGLSDDDFRIRESVHALQRYGPNDRIDYAAFCAIIRSSILLIERVLQGNMVIPDFASFCDEIEAIFAETEKNKSGDVARYIPQLARVNPEQFAVALCTIDGQRFETGDSKVDFCVQSCCKPINYCIALEQHGEDKVHNHIGREPSGRSFDEMVLDDSGHPHNPLINAGAIMSTSLIEPELDAADRFDHIMRMWTALAGGEKPRFNNSVYLSERETADRNFALGYMMSERQAFPKGTDLVSTLELYFQCCSIEMNAQMMATVAATLANGGVCPVSGQRVLETKTVQNCLSLMYSCGMYDFSGEFAFTIGLPAKSGVGGGLMIVVPNVMGICTWSPRLDTLGNSVRGVEFCRRLVKTFNFHNYDNLTGLTEKKDPRINHIRAQSDKVNWLIWAASKGDLGAVQRMAVEGANLGGADYDGRTPMHLAAAEGRRSVVEYFIEQGVEINQRDRWNGTPLDDAYMNSHEDIKELLEKNGAVRGRVDDNFAWLADSVDQGAEHATDSNPSSPQAESGSIIELIWAASKGSLEPIQRLIARGVSWTGADYDGRTPLHLAASEGHCRVVKLFIDQGTDVNPRDRWGNTPLEDASRHGHETIVSLLQAHGGISAG